ncbi:type IV pilus inner membrane component PilO [Pseudomonas mucidolens]|uniref:Type IV pilus assembly protein PilO n=1 Tax=Pseudomonas mucidolens TaxID=46679 RepID=A0A1H2NNC1_9PSED|nr:type 4a pilus biogenesis protein PilO [Pseudomonas mucidolens]SDV06838.1 type IV pilus assembly protein PilO [Pseudomonas mucidolens]SQH31495.1 pilus assembly protein, PilO [Pseudomonas mucidolens]
MTLLSGPLGSVVPLFSTLYHAAGQWPWPAKMLVGGALASLLWLSGDAFYLNGAREQLHRQEIRELALREQFADKAVQSARLEVLSRQLEVMRGAFSEQLHRLPSATEVPSLLEDIARLGLTSGLTLEELRLLDEQVQPLYAELPIQISLIGTYHDLATFISAVAELPRIVTLHDFLIRPAGGRDAGLLHLKMLAKTYRYSAPRPLP